MNTRKTKRKKKNTKKSNGSMKVIPVKPFFDDDEKEYHDLLPSIKRNRGSLITILGSTASGKTTLINNLLLNKNMWGGDSCEGAFDEVYIFSPSIHLDDSCRFLREHFITFDMYNDDRLQEILDEQKSYEKKKMPKIMIVIDDSVGMIHQNSTLNHFLSRYRHYNSNVIISSQAVRALSPIARSNTTHSMIFAVPNDKEFEKLEEEYGGVYGGQFKKLYMEATNQKFHFLYLILRELPAEAYKNFDRKLNYTPNHSLGVEDDTEKVEDLNNNKDIE
tara:strand:- start:379 stop:1206 length:828 start_codon:yes stop_codon:yes gene_type:complete